MDDPPRERALERRVKGILDDFQRGPAPVRRAPPQDLGAAVLETRPSPVVALDIPLKIAAAVIAIALPATVSAILSGEDLRLAALLGLGGLALLFNLIPAMIAAAIPSLMVLFTTYRIDERGIQSRTQLLSKNVKTVTWNKVTALVERRTLFDRVFGLQRFQVIAYGERGTRLALVGLPSDRVFRDRIAAGMKDAASVQGLFDND